MTFPLLILLCLGVLLTSTPSRANMLSSFRPRMLGGIYMDLTVEGEYSSDKDETESADSTEEEFDIRESINLSSIGYVYHPYLLLYQVSGSFDLDQNMSSSDGDSQWETGVDTRGELQIAMFRRKPYNLTAHVSKERPFRFQTASSGSSDGAEKLEYGLEGEYRKRSWFCSMIFDSTIQEREDRSDSNDTYRITYWYSRKGVNFNVNLNHTLAENDSDTSDGTATSDRIEITNNWQVGKFTFDTSGSIMFTESESRTRSTTGTENTVTTSTSGTDGEEMRFAEKIDIDLPMNMDAEFEYTYDYEEDSPTGDDSDGAVTFRKQHDANFRLMHTLFDSVTTTTEANFDKQDSGGGDFLNHSYELSSEYTKLLPGGSIGASISNNLHFSQRHGRPSYQDIQSGIEESFYLRTLADQDTLIIYVLDQSCDGLTGSAWESCLSLENNWVALSETTHYTLDTSGQPIYVELVDEAMEDLDLDEDQNTATASEGPYTLRVSYSLQEANYEVQSNSSSISGTLTLLDGLFTSFLKHTLTSQEYTEGDEAFGDLSPEVINNEAGIAFYWAGASFASTYSILDSDSKQDTWDNIISYGYAFPISAKLGFNLNLNYQFTAQDVEAGGASSSDERDIYNAILGMNYNIPRLGATMRGSSSYTSTRGGISGVYFNEEENLWLPEPETDEDRDSFENNVTLASIIPRLKVNCSLTAYYNFQDNVSDQTEKNEYGYGVTLSRLWTFGSTTLEVDGEYESSESRTKHFEEGTESLDNNENLKIHFLLTRKFM